MVTIPPLLCLYPWFYLLSHELPSGPVSYELMLAHYASGEALSLAVGEGSASPFAIVWDKLEQDRVFRGATR